ncbi:hypothetical protein [Acidocella sp. KAb 2-4]|nr:hypothetical protein [Acidocella sp. KAb 2-4]MCB5945929.1 hypothetical protein [Acidocella sp. KAb 2-4]
MNGALLAWLATVPAAEDVVLEIDGTIATLRLMATMAGYGPQGGGA